MKSIYPHILETESKYAISIALLVGVTGLFLVLCLASINTEILPYAIILIVLLMAVSFILRRQQRKSERRGDVYASIQTTRYKDMGLMSIPVSEKRAESISSYGANTCRDDRSDNEIDDVSTQPDAEEDVLDTFVKDMLSIDVQSEADGKDLVIFKYQGGYFQASMLGKGLLRIVFPRIFSISPAAQDFLCRVINRINSSFAICRLVATISEHGSEVMVHGVADINYRGTRKERVDLVLDIISLFFEQQRNLIVATSVRDAERALSGIPVDEDCRTAYKDISIN